MRVVHGTYCQSGHQVVCNVAACNVASAAFLPSSPPRKAPTLLVRLPLSLYLLFSSLYFLSLYLIFFSRFRLSSRNLALKARTAILTLFPPPLPPPVHVPPSLTFSVSLSLFLISAACHSTNPRVEFKGPDALASPAFRAPPLPPSFSFWAMGAFTDFSRKPATPIIFISRNYSGRIILEYRSPRNRRRFVEYLRFITRSLFGDKFEPVRKIALRSSIRRYYTSLRGNATHTYESTRCPVPRLIF